MLIKKMLFQPIWSIFLCCDFFSKITVYYFFTLYVFETVLEFNILEYLFKTKKIQNIGWKINKIVLIGILYPGDMQVWFQKLKNTVNWPSAQKNVFIEIFKWYPKIIIKKSFPTILVVGALNIIFTHHSIVNY